MCLALSSSLLHDGESWRISYLYVFFAKLFVVSGILIVLQMNNFTFFYSKLINLVHLQKNETYLIVNLYSN